MSSISWTDENQVGAVYTSQEIFEKVGFNLKTNQMFSVHTTLEELKNGAITGHFKFGFVFEKNLRREITTAPSYSKSSAFKMFSIHKKMEN